jgi:hypothetical protein
VSADGDGRDDLVFREPADPAHDLLLVFTVLDVTDEGPLLVVGCEHDPEERRE